MGCHPKGSLACEEVIYFFMSWGLDCGLSEVCGRWKGPECGLKQPRWYSLAHPHTGSWASLPTGGHQGSVLWQVTARLPGALTCAAGDGPYPAHLHQPGRGGDSM